VSLEMKQGILKILPLGAEINENSLVNEAYINKYINKFLT